MSLHDAHTHTHYYFACTNFALSLVTQVARRADVTNSFPGRAVSLNVTCIYSSTTIVCFSCVFYMP